ncbi:MAG: hypothetical protein ETSY1_00210 [Candidatus Entotheonella factor]|uniref:Uncharacterized protein n=1 Tax=Entotheonella factor TaxID=1429438 RepID=W4M150_ENTF1|nr:DUF6635 family protein [Candidatus Entotheonella palauensis]ETX03392.1 MAG: hypothetical protein ETSY1_00210 [Candidatus Entotheonella factor]
MEDAAEAQVDIKVSEEIIRHAMQQAVSAYIAQRRARVPYFIRKHFSLRGVLRLYRNGLGADLFKASFNLFWAWPRLLARLLSSIAASIGLRGLAACLSRIPTGFETNVQRELTWLIYTELLEVPFQDGKREAQHDALLEEILNQPEMTPLYRPYVEQLRERHGYAEFRTGLENNLREFYLTREAASDMAANTMTLAAGGLYFQQITPGALAISGVISQAIAYHLAVSNFFLGPTLGALYYHYFPPTPAASLTITIIVGIMVVLTLVASFAGIIVDPILAILGVHERRLQTFITHLEHVLMDQQDSSYRIYDHYYARVFDFIDYLILATSRLKL